MEDKALQRRIWQTVSNPGAVLWRGAVAGMWKPRKKGGAMDMEITLWGEERPPEKPLRALGEAQAAQRGLRLNTITIIK